MSQTPFDNFDDAPRVPMVVIVDDEDQSSFAELIHDQGVEAVAIGPDDLDSELLARATVVVLDQYLENWPQRAKLELPLTLRVPDGLALAAVLRSHVEHSGGKSGPTRAPVAFALRTGELDKLGVGLPRGAREHLLARQYNLEWVFSKGEQSTPTGPSVAARVAALARASSTLPTDWTADSHDPGLGWLALPSSPWADDVRWQVEQCRPPQHVVAERSAGIAWLRWFLHKVLPFPTFLLDEMHLSVALGLTVNALKQVIRSESDMATRLNEVLYRGPLDNFLGNRWWRAGVSHLVEEMIEEGSAYGEGRTRSIAAAVSHLHGSKLEEISVDDPVVGVRADYTIIPSPLSAANCVRLQPDEWPPYADDAWSEKSAVTGEDADRDLLALVVLTDRWRINSEADEFDDVLSSEISGDESDGLEARDADKEPQ
ncbi:hypothetical protein [Catellatospora sp. NPDC049133]|uniref:hypothetical protein n=1 Tax=Catellatospora sp. NPDC049133 TaxID=3155499 RepID=UPI00340563A3